MHFHGFHPSEMDGVPGSGPGGSIQPGDSFSYEFDAEPFGLDASGGKRHEPGQRRQASLRSHALAGHDDRGRAVREALA